MTATPVVHARRSGMLLWLVALFGGLLFTAIHLALVYTALREIDARLLIADLCILALVLIPAAWYIRSLTMERQRHAAQIALLDVLSEPRNIGDAARAALVSLARHRIADAGVIALADEHGEGQRVVAAVGYPDGWAKAAPSVHGLGSATPAIARERDPHPWLQPLGSRLGKRPWVARIPITSNGDAIGLLLLVARQSGPLRDRAVLATIATQVGAALDHAALYEASYERERDLEVQDQRRREFVAAISHEIRTPLMSIQAFADLLRMDAGGMDTAAEELVGSLTYGVERLSRLVTDLIDLGRSGGQELEVHLAEIDARDSVRAAESMMRPAFLLREQSITAGVPEAPLWAIADPHRLEQVILAVLANANRHAPPASAIAITAQRTPDGRIRIEICDEGPGIAREDRERIFEPYFRVRGPAGDAVPGSGLGLAVARRLVERQGGRIWVEGGVDDSGARFVIEVRAATERT